MEKSMIKGITIGAGALVAVVVLGTAGCGEKYAEVVSVKEVKETVATPREVCEDVVVSRKAPVQDEHRITGTVIGAAAGGLLGHQIGGGRGKTLATIAGAAAGGYAGNKVQKNMQDKDVVQSTERRCKTVKDTSEKLVGYDVTYRLNGKEGVVRLDQRPGPQIPVKDGQLQVGNLQGK